MYPPRTASERVAWFNTSRQLAKMTAGTEDEDEDEEEEGVAPLLSSGLSITLSFYGFVPNNAKTKLVWGSRWLEGGFPQIAWIPLDSLSLKCRIALYG